MLYALGVLAVAGAIAGLTYYAWRHRQSVQRLVMDGRIFAQTRCLPRHHWRCVLQATLLEKMVDGMLAVNTRQHILDANPPMRAMLGIPWERAREQSLASVAPEIHCAFESALRAQPGVTARVCGCGDDTRCFDVCVWYVDT